MNAHEISATARSLGFTKISGNTYDGAVLVWLYQRGRRSATCDDAYLCFKGGMVYGPRPEMPGLWSDRSCADIEAVRAELAAAARDPKNSLRR